MFCIHFSHWEVGEESMTNIILSERLKTHIPLVLCQNFEVL
jgi:hypothetical protein